MFIKPSVIYDFYNSWAGTPTLLQITNRVKGYTILPHLYHRQSKGLYDFTSFVSQTVCKGLYEFTSFVSHTVYRVIWFYLICITDRVKGYMILPHLYHRQSTVSYDFTSFVSHTEYRVIWFYLTCITDRVQCDTILPHLYHRQSKGLYEFTSFISQTE